MKFRTGQSAHAEWRVQGRLGLMNREEGHWMAMRSSKEGSGWDAVDWLPRKITLWAWVTALALHAIAAPSSALLYWLVCSFIPSHTVNPNEFNTKEALSAVKLPTFVKYTPPCQSTLCYYSNYHHLHYHTSHYTHIMALISIISIIIIPIIIPIISIIPIIISIITINTYLKW